jgi:hypothetical protein
MTFPQAFSSPQAARDLGAGESVLNIMAVGYLAGGPLPET